MSSLIRILERYVSNKVTADYFPIVIAVVVYIVLRHSDYWNSKKSDKAKIALFGVLSGVSLLFTDKKLLNIFGLLLIMAVKEIYTDEDVKRKKIMVCTTIVAGMAFLALLSYELLT